MNRQVNAPVQAPMAAARGRAPKRPSGAWMREGGREGGEGGEGREGGIKEDV